MNAARVYRWAVTASILAYGLILLGGLVSATHSGLGCGPQWPLCHDRWVPLFQSRETLLEYLHRVVGTVVGLATLALAWAAWREPVRPALRALAAAAVLMVIVQGLLGAVTVWMDLPPAVSTLHLLTSQLYLGVLVTAAALAAAGRGRASVPASDAGRPAVPGLAGWATAAALVTIVVITLGALVKHHMAGLACGVQFPLCRDAVIPAGLSGTVLLHWSHRIGAYTAAALVLLTFRTAARHRRRAPGLYRLAAAALVLVAAQITLGVTTVFTRINPAVSVAHLGVATLLWVVLLALAGSAWAPGLAGRAAAPVAAADRAGLPLAGDPAGAR